LYLAANLVSESTLERHLLPGISSRGVPKELEDTVFPFEFNNLGSLQRVLDDHRGEVACVIMEAARSYLPQPGFLEGVRRLTQDHDTVLIFDEVVTGFRTARGGAQEYFGVIPDVATFAKCISNGFALGAVVGKREVMEVAIDSFISSVYWAEATGLAAGLATMKEYLARDVCAAVQGFGQSFMEGCRKLIDELGVPARIVGLPSFPALTFQETQPQRLDAIVTLYMQEMAKRGLFGGPGHFFCLQHTEADLQNGLTAIGEALNVVQKALHDGDILKFLECPVRQSGFRRLV
jgi:glutamate-1-semialdehyde 2,1-aminomutase